MEQNKKTSRTSPDFAANIDGEAPSKQGMPNESKPDNGTWADARPKRPYEVDDFEQKEKKFPAFFQLVQINATQVSDNDKAFADYLNGTVGNLSIYSNKVFDPPRLISAQDEFGVEREIFRNEFAAKLRTIATDFILGQEIFDCFKETAKELALFQYQVDALQLVKPNHEINDEYFMRDLTRLKQLRSFLIQETIPSGSLPSFGELNLLQYRSEGRAPTAEEWTSVESSTESLFRSMNGPLRRKFVLGEIPSWIATLPLALAATALVALCLAIIFTKGPVFLMPPYLVWLMSLGAIGAIAFIGMNALSIQEDVTFDLTNRRLLILRIVLGALFGLVITLPFGFKYFKQFCDSIWNAPEQSTKNVIDSPSLTNQALFLLLPFVLGFSTTLVIMIMNRLVDSIQAFFGRTSAAERSGNPVSATVDRSSSPG
jgi:hypothetical protein